MTTTTAQTATDSPYSRYGYGQLSNNSFGAANSMGGASIGMRRDNQINPSNPASYSVIDSTTFLFDFAISAQNGYFSEGTSKETKPNGNIEHMAIQFPITKGMGASVGVMPYSFVGYQFGSDISNSNLTGVSQYNGDGGFSQAFLGLAISPISNLSIGANVNYIFGNINHNSTISNSNDGYTITRLNQIHGRGLKLDFGAQWTKKISQEQNICFGLTYTPKTKLKTTSKSIYAISSTADTTTTYESYELAASYGAGLSWQLNKKWTFAADGVYQKWSDALYYSKKDTLNNRIKLAAGFEFTPNLNSRRYIDHVKYRFGANFSTNYLNIRNQKLSEYGVGFGLGLPFKSNKSLLNLSVDYSKVTPEYTQFIKESYLKFTLSLTFNEYWFFKRKID